jgi:hypothetical protein
VGAKGATTFKITPVCIVTLRHGYYVTVRIIFMFYLMPVFFIIMMTVTTLYGIVSQVACNKSSLLQKNILQKILQPFTMNITKESIYKSYKNAYLGGLGRET